ncbi:SPFH domain-containing protein [Streptomyces catenulae]|uniref:SPFH domain-containing protein n=1 Tax=Streptomyces catenulae TaxID=66875 RepID=A0ABV2Z324_9ACTN|nr:SPFH domain-containing protein [Streptomyces catenulae]
MASIPDDEQHEGDSAPVPAKPKRPYNAWRGDGIPMDKLFREGAAEETADGAAAERHGPRAEADTAEQPLVLVPLLDVDTGLPFRDEFEDALPARGTATRSVGKATRAGGTATRSAAPAAADAAVAGIAAANGLLDTAERTGRDAPGPPDGGRAEEEPPPRTGRTGAERDAGKRAGKGAGQDAGKGPAERARREPSRSAAQDTGEPAARGGDTRTPVRRSPSADPALTERRGPALPGWLALAVGLLALVGVVALLWWRGVLPESAVRATGLPVTGPGRLRGREGLLIAAAAVVALLAFGGLTRGRVGSALVLSLFGRYRGTVRRAGLLWISPMLLRRRVDVRLRHWRSEPMPAVDADGAQLRAVVMVVWRVKDTARALLAVEDHAEYLREQVEAAMARVLSQAPADAFQEEGRPGPTAPSTLRDAEAVGDALTRMLAADCRPVGIEVFSAQPTRIEYAPEVAGAMQRRQIAAIDARHRDTVLTSVVDAVDDTVRRLTARGLVELDDYERKALVKDLTVAFYTARGSAASES